MCPDFMDHLYRIIPIYKYSINVYLLNIGRELIFVEIDSTSHPH